MILSLCPGVVETVPVHDPLHVLADYLQPFQHLLQDALFLLFFSCCHFERTTEKGYLRFAVRGGVWLFPLDSSSLLRQSFGEAIVEFGWSPAISLPVAVVHKELSPRMVRTIGARHTCLTD